MRSRSLNHEGFHLCLGSLDGVAGFVAFRLGLFGLESVHVLVGHLVASSARVKLVPGLVLLFSHFCSSGFNLSPPIHESRLNLDFINNNCSTLCFLHIGSVLSPEFLVFGISCSSLVKEGLANSGESTPSKNWLCSNNLYLLAERA